MSIHESGEDYLETILILKAKNEYVRSIDIANELHYSKPSISRAMGILKQAGYIVTEKSGNILLTEKGMQKANDVYERHRLISQYLIVSLGLDPETAEHDACRIEHDISKKTFELIKKYINKNSDNRNQG